MSPWHNDKSNLPEEQALVTGTYEQLNVFGPPTGIVVDVRRGETLPPAPRRYTWRYIRDDAQLDFRP
jgi:hypothetical protein